MPGRLRSRPWRDAWADVFTVVSDGDESRITALATELAQAHPMTEHDLDRVIMTVALRIADNGRVRWTGEYVLHTTRDRTDTAMARTVSVTLACGVVDILTSAMTPGLHCATDDVESVDRWLAFLREHGVACAARQRDVA